MTPEREAQIISHLNTGASWQATTRKIAMGDATVRRYAKRSAAQGLIPDRRLSTAVQNSLQAAAAWASACGRQATP